MLIEDIFSSFMKRSKAFFISSLKIAERKYEMDL